MLNDSLKHVPTFAPAKPYKFDSIKFPVFVEEKLDGMRLMLRRGFAITRGLNVLGQPTNRWDSLPEHIQKIATDFWLDGELLLQGKPASEIPTALIGNSSELQFMAFRVPAKDLVFLPHQHHEFLQSQGFFTSRFIKFTRTGNTTKYCNTQSLNANHLFCEARNLGIEGWVLKQRIKYPSWFKLKLVDTYDLIVTGLKPAEAGKFAGLVGALLCSAYINGQLEEVAAVSGMDDTTRMALSEKDIGRVVEVRANMIASQGRLRHPRFIRWRDDKNASECILS